MSEDIIEELRTMIEKDTQFFTDSELDLILRAMLEIECLREENRRLELARCPTRAPHP